MKNFTAKLKNLDYKQLAIEHGEKAVLGLVGLFVLLALAGTSWSRYERSPKEFLDKVAKGEASLSESRWPEEERQKLMAAPDVVELLNQTDTQTELALYEYRTPFFWPLYSKKEKYKEPEWLPVEELIADPGYVILEFAAESEEEGEGEEGEVAAAEGEGEAAETAVADTTQPRRGPALDEIAPRKAGAGRTGVKSRARSALSARGGLRSRGGLIRGFGANTEEDFGEYAAEMEAPGVPEGMDLEQEYGAEPGEMMEPMSIAGPDEMTSEMGAGVRTTRTTKARGMRYIAVRGVFPYKKQLEKLAEALNIPMAADAEPYLDFYDFVLERQKAVPGPNPWSGPWEKVDIQDAYDVLKKVVDYDVPIVDVAYTDAVFTMPLPYRVAGEWGEKVTHPRIKKLTKEQAEEQMLLNAKMVELYEKMKKEQEPFQKRGFAIGQVDIRDVRSQVAGTNMQQVIDMIRQELQSDDYQSFQEGLGGKLDPEQLIQDLTKKPVSLSAQVLLFRYLDFDVEPGNAYRYRVRLVVRNPNYQRPIAELVDPASAEGFTRMTPWSEPSNMAFVPQDEEVFLSGVNRVRGRSDISADLEVFKWYEDSGTMIRANLGKLHAGDQVAGVVTTEVLRPAEQTFEEEEGVEVKTKNILVDLAPRSLSDPRFDPRQHPDLGLDPRARTGLPVADEVLLLKPSGDFVCLDSVSQKEARAQALARLEAQNKPWEFLKEKTASLSSRDKKKKKGRRGRRGRGGPAGFEEGYMEELEALEGMMGEQDMEADQYGAEEGGMFSFGRGSGRRSGRANPLRRRFSTRRSR